MRQKKEIDTAECRFSYGGASGITIAVKIDIEG